MPEGDTVYLAAMRMRAALAGHRLLRTDFRIPRLATVDLSGARVEDVVARGKHLMIPTSSGWTVHTHFRMDGAWHLYGPGERWRGPGWQVRAVLETAPCVAVGFRLPVLDLWRNGAEGEALAHLGPDPLRDDWDAREVERRLRSDRSRAVGEALLDQRVVAGVGNVYRNEICFLRGVDPRLPVGEVRDLGRMVLLVKRLFEANRGRAGHVTTGDPRRGRSHWVYGRQGLPCRRCGTPIQRQSARSGPAEDRVIYWCPHCQAR